MADLPPERLEGAERRVNAVFAKVIGGVMLWIGVAFGVLLVWASYKTAMLNRPLEFVPLLFLAGFAILAAFCSLVGWRLFLYRPNRFGSILSPWGWRILGGMFGASAVGLLAFWVVLLRDGASIALQVTAVTSVASSAAFCIWCLTAARQAIANAARSNGAL